MNKHRYILYIICLLLFSGTVKAYVAYTGCPDFTNIGASYVETFYGQTNDPFKHDGIIDGRHTVITQQGTDPNTGNALNLLPPTETQVIRLGNDHVGAEAEAVFYHFIVDPDNPILLVKFAVVFEDPNHAHIEQPRFVIRITDRNGNLIEECAEYDVSAGAELDGFQTHIKNTTNIIRWRDWTNVGLDMSRFSGQEVLVQFINYDCTLSGHFGYAYFTASCIPNKLNLSYCGANSITVEAPDNFASYLWDDGTTNRTSTRTVSGSDLYLSCLVTSATGCRFTLTALVSSVNAPTQNSIINHTICQGQSYTDSYFDLPPQQKAGNFSFTNTFINPNTCNADITTILQLEVLPHYFPLIESICHGESYVKNGFSISNPLVGTYRDTLFLTSSLNCDSIVCLELTVNQSFSMPNTIQGETSPCTNEVLTYSFMEITPSTYQWDVPDNLRILSGQGSSQIQVYFEDDTPGTITMTGKNGCGSGSLHLQVTPNRSYYVFAEDTICSGEVYQRNGVNLGIIDSLGYQIHSYSGKTVSGCDSVITIALVVFPSPSLHIITQDSILCNSKPITLHAVASNESISFTVVPEVAIGDILCADGSIVKPNMYAASGKLGVGVVFYVDETGKHGWAAAKDEVKTVWSSADTEFDNIAAVPDYNVQAATIRLDDGYILTQAIRDEGDATDFPIGWCTDFANGWYVPAFAQMRSLLTTRSYIAASLTLIGGTALGTISPYQYWTSNEGAGLMNIRYNLCLTNAGGQSRDFKNAVKCVRAIKNF